MFLIGANQFKKLPSDLMYKFKIFVIEVLNQSWEEFLHDICYISITLACEYSRPSSPICSYMLTTN